MSHKGSSGKAGSKLLDIESIKVEMKHCSFVNTSQGMYVYKFICLLNSQVPPISQQKKISENVKLMQSILSV